MNKESLIGIVTVLYNSESVIKDFFLSLATQSYKNLILYIVDNKTPDDSIKECRKYEKQLGFPVKYIQNDDNYGVAKGNNIGIKKALEDGCDYILLANNDIKLQSETINILHKQLKEKEALIAVPKIYFYNSNKLWYAGGKFCSFPKLCKHLYFLQEDVDGKFETPQFYDYAPTCFMLISKLVFDKIGFMDEKYFCYYDDTDFMYRAKLNNINCYYCPKSTIEHKESVSTGKWSDFHYYYLIRNRIYFIRKFKKSYKINYFFEIIYHCTLRFIKMINNQHQWEVISKALKDSRNI